MIIRYHVSLTALSAIVALAIVVPGCRNATSATPQRGVRKVQGLLTLYFNAAREQGHPPTNEEEFKKVVQSQGRPIAERLGLASVDELFVSSRDGKPYVIVYGKGKSGVVVYEAEGVDGVREVGFQTGQVKDVNQEQFAALGL